MPQESDLEAIIASVIDHGFHLHNVIGPGLLESAYEAFLAGSLREAGFNARQHVSLPARYRDITIENAYCIDLLVNTYCIDLLVNDRLIVEIKSLERIAPVHSKRLLTYLRLPSQPVGLLINFGAPLFKQGVIRVIDSRSQYGRPNNHVTA